LLDKALKQVELSFCDDFYRAAVRQIAHVAGESKQEGAPGHELTESDALDATTDDGVERCVGLCGHRGAGGEVKPSLRCAT